MSTTAAKVYTKLETQRRPFIDRARDCSLLTIPSVMPEEGHSGQNAFPQPYNSTGSRGCTHLSSRILMTLLPPGGRFFRLQYDTMELQKATGMDDLLGEMDAALALIEEQVHKEVDASNFRIQLFWGWNWNWNLDLLLLLLLTSWWLYLRRGLRLCLSGRLLLILESACFLDWIALGLSNIFLLFLC